jgi:general secretion pathway protein A
MYESCYGLRELPFKLTADPKYLFLTRRHREALSTLEYGLFSAKAVTVLIGEVGTGKTTLIGAALESDRCRNVTCVHLTNPTLTRAEFVEMLAQRFGLSASARGSKTAMLVELESVLRERRAAGAITAIVIDEAQSMRDELLEEVRLLANIETKADKLLPVVLAGQPELGYRLNEPGLRQLKQRITLRCEVEAFTTHETAGYITQRVKVAGGDATRIFTREAVMLIHEKSGGIPRTINVLCDNALLTGFALNRQPIDSEVVFEVMRDLDLGDARIHNAGSIATVDDSALGRRGDGLEQVPAAANVSKPDADEAEKAEVPGDGEIEPQPLFQGYRQSRRLSLFGR